MMQLFGTPRSRLLAGLVVSFGLAALLLLLSSPDSSLGRRLRHVSFDTLQRWNPPPGFSPSNSPVLLVYLDLDSYRAQGLSPGDNWPRALHTKLLNQLAGARAVIFDFIFDQPSADPAVDRAFAETLRRHGRVILAAELNAYDQNSGQGAWAKMQTLLLPHEELSQAAAGWGLATFQTDEDFTMRQFFPGLLEQGQPSLTWAAGRLLGLVDSNAVPPAEPRWIRYYGPPLTIPHVSYSAALGSNDLRPDFFRDKIVFVGARPFVGSFRERRDEHRSPFHSWGENNLFMPAVEVHATQMLNLVRGDRLAEFSEKSQLVVGLLFTLACGLGLIWLRPFPATLVSAALAGSVLAASHWSFQSGIWFPWLSLLAVPLPGALVASWLYHFAEWYQARQRLEAARRADEAKIREQAALLDKAHDAILVQDLTGHVLYANPSAERLYGWTMPEWSQAHPMDQIFSPDPEEAREARNATLAQGEWNGELRQVNRAGQNLVVASRWTLIRDASGQPVQLLLINSDITDKKQLEAQFLRTQRLDTIGTLAGGMAHDLNNALSPVLLGVQLLRRRTSDEESGRILSLMESSTHRGADMVRQVLLFTRGKEGGSRRFPLGPLLKELQKMARETFPKNITVDSFLPEDLWEVRGNVTELHQVLLNLCVNARDALPQGGRLSLLADNVTFGPEDLSPDGPAVPGDFVSLSVSDTGTGMPPEVLARIFEPFFTTKGEGRGTGLGLATVQRIVRNHGGVLRVESVPGEGTTFEILLPRAVEADATSIPPETKVAPRGEGELILVVDGEEAIRDLLHEGLTAHGYRVEGRGSGPEAILVCHQFPNQVRLVISDLNMPIMSGPRLLQELRSLQPNLPCIFTSGSGGAAEVPAEPGVVQLSKPFMLEDLLTLLPGMLRASSSSNRRN